MCAHEDLRGPMLTIMNGVQLVELPFISKRVSTTRGERKVKRESARKDRMKSRVLEQNETLSKNEQNETLSKNEVCRNMQTRPFKRSY